MGVKKTEVGIDFSPVLVLLDENNKGIISLHYEAPCVFLSEQKKMKRIEDESEML